ncbi:MAG: TetR/AcrR family transcriptional regulator [Saprospiraceae bacterium]
MDKTPQEKESTEQRIFEAARALFVEKGMAGTRMQEIADKAGINKALLHYYYRSKDKLYTAVVKAVINVAIPKIIGIFESDLPLKEKIEHFLDVYIGLISKNTFLPLFILTELNKHPQEFIDSVMPKDLPKPDQFFKQVEDEISAGNIRPINPRHLIVNLISMSIFPFVAKPMEQLILQLSEEEMQQFLSQRKQEVREFVFASLRPY